MRVISGKYKRSNLVGDHIEGTRPTMDRIKESLFAMLQVDIPGSVCLDLFAGSGALGIEAISMGAKFCYFVDKSNEAIKALKTNIKNLKIENGQVLRTDYAKAIKSFNGAKLDFVFLDPPYQKGLLQKAMRLIHENKILDQKGQVVCEYSEETLEEFDHFELIKSKKYGNTKINVYMSKDL